MADLVVEVIVLWAYSPRAANTWGSLPYAVPIKGLHLKTNGQITSTLQNLIIVSGEGLEEVQGESKMLT